MNKNVTLPLLYQVLKQIQGQVEGVESALRDLNASQIVVRQDIHRLEGGQLRLERMNAETHLRLDRLEKRLSSSDV